MELTQSYPLTEGRVYFDTAVTGACPESTISLIEEYIRGAAATLRGKRGPITGSERWGERRVGSKRLFAKAIGASEGEVAFVPNATMGINTAFAMVAPGRGENVVTTDLSFPMGAVVVNKQREKEVEPRFIRCEGGRVDPDAFEEAVDDDTRAVLVDQATWFNGFLYDLSAISEIAHDHGAYLIVDATQSVGALDWDVKSSGVDFLTSSTYKWMLGGPLTLSAGFLFIDEEHIDELKAPYVGNQTLQPEQAKTNVEDRFDLYEYKPREGIGRLEVFPRSELSYVAAGNSLGVLLSHGIDRIETHIKGLGTKLIDGLLDRGYGLQTPVEEERRIYLNVKVPEFKEIGRRLAETCIVVSPRVGGLRVSPHFYNTEDEVETFLESLDEAING
ncbi:MAG: aminotransferase class V-fold PLP-dependent enzyme [Candidatus Bathyarchaeota archaeon]|jgi:selenocysteine lyase/cysteine desulfurase